MSVLTKKEILNFIKIGQLNFDPMIDQFQLQPHAVDLRLGFDFQIPEQWFMNETGRHALNIDYLEEKTNGFKEINLKEGQIFEILPQETIIATTLEKIDLNHPGLMAVLYPRSSLNRRGLALDLSGIVDANYKGHLIIPLKNNTRQVIKLYPGERICQLVFEFLVSELSIKESSFHGLVEAKYTNSQTSSHTKDSNIEIECIKSGNLNHLKQNFALEIIQCREKKIMVQYPYLPEGRTIEYVDKDNIFMQKAQQLIEGSGCDKQPTGAVVIKDNEVIGRGTNAGTRISPCPRDLMGYTTGQGYHLCTNRCKQVGHAEETAVKDALLNHGNSKDADVYMYGHWWCCKKCWDIMIEAGIKNVYLVEGATEMFKK